jgi:hypothetical protein
LTVYYCEQAIGFSPSYSRSLLALLRLSRGMIADARPLCA